MKHGTAVSRTDHYGEEALWGVGLVRRSTESPDAALFSRKTVTSV